MIASLQKALDAAAANARYFNVPFVVFEASGRDHRCERLTVAPKNVARIIYHPDGHREFLDADDGSEVWQRPLRPGSTDPTPPKYKALVEQLNGSCRSQPVE